MHRKPFVLLSAVTLLCSLTACSDPFADVECSPVRNKLCPSGQTCVDNTCRPVCDRASQCSSSEACIDNACVAYSAKCTTLDGCVEGWTCNLAAGSCEKLAPLGAACTSGTACASGFCVDSRCCESACDGTCVSCNGSVTGDADGVCANVPVGQDPRDDCIDPVACDGAGACAAGQVGDPCTGPGTCDASFCVDGVCCATACQGTCESCSAALTGGTDGTCAPTLLGEDPDDECTGALACDGDGKCFAKVQGDACTENYECSTGFCVDGFCCDSACDSPCQSCRASKNGGVNGTCGNIAPGDSKEPNTCPNGTMCDGTGSCWAQADGQACGDNFQCVSGFCCGSKCRPLPKEGSAPTNGEDLYGVWGESLSNIWAVGANRTIITYDGTSWSTFTGTIPAGPTDLRTVRGSGSTVMILGDNPQGIYRLNEGNFEAMTFSPNAPDIVFTDLWVAGPSRAWAIGSPCTVMRWDGGDWYQVPCPAGPGGEDYSALELRSVYGGFESTDLLFVTGSAGCSCFGPAPKCSGPDIVLQWQRDPFSPSETWSTVGNFPPGASTGRIYVQGVSPVLVKQLPVCAAPTLGTICGIDGGYQWSGSEWISTPQLSHTLSVGHRKDEQGHLTVTVNEVINCSASLTQTRSHKFCSRIGGSAIEPTAKCTPLSEPYTAIWSVSSCETVAVGPGGSYMIRP